MHFWVCLEFCLLYLTWLIFSPCCRSLILLLTFQLLYIYHWALRFEHPWMDFYLAAFVRYPFFSILIKYDFKKKLYITISIGFFWAYIHVYIVMWISLFDWYQSIVVYCHVTLSYICNIVILWFFFSNKEKTIYISDYSKLFIKISY